MAINYIKQLWQDTVSAFTPITAARLNHMEDGIKASCDAWDSVSQFCCGEVKLTPAETNKLISKRITFSNAFPAPPAILLTPYSGAPQNVNVSVENVSRTGFDLNLVRTGVVETKVFWLAVEL